jgi:hypothetical protein
MSEYINRFTDAQENKNVYYSLEKVIIQVQGGVEGVKISQCDFVAVCYGIYAEHCLQVQTHQSLLLSRCIVSSIHFCRRASM